MTLYTPVPTGRQNDSSVKNAIGKLNSGAGQTAEKLASAWCLLNGAATTPSIAAGTNIRKVEKVATGQFRLWFTVSQGSSDYAVLCSCAETSPAIAPALVGCYKQTPGYFEIVVYSLTGPAASDADGISILVFGSLVKE